MVTKLFPQFTRLFPAATPHVAVQYISAIILICMTSAFVLTVPKNTPKPDGTSEENRVLGVSSVRITTSDIQELSDQYSRWQQTVREHPDYRDGYYMLAILAYQMNRTSEAREYLTEIKRLDPNYEGISRLESLILKSE